MNILDVAQGSKEWFDARLATVTASRVADALDLLKKGGESAARRQYRLEMVLEIMLEKPADHYVSPAMQYGIENEPLARTAYEMATGVDVELVGLVFHPRISRAAASPDGLVGDDGLVEFKVPEQITHIRYALADEVPEDYKPQMLWQLACSERKWCDFVSYDPRAPLKYQLFVKRLERDDEKIAEMETGVVKFLEEVQETWARLQEAFGGPSVIEEKLKQSIARSSGPQPVVDALEIGEEDVRA